jgi:hypothetical protein
MLIIPWGFESEWQEVNEAIRHLINRHKNQLQNAESIAQSIVKQYDCLSPLMDELCLATCPWCPEPCCLHAKIWYDHRDLIFLHLANIDPPAGQVITNQQETCRYLGSTGCTLSRISRPFICTWYICPTQHGALKKMFEKAQKTTLHAIQNIKKLRNKMEDEFIRVTAGP